MPDPVTTTTAAQAASPSASQMFAAQAGLQAGQGLMGTIFAKRGLRLSVAANKELGDYSYNKMMQAWGAQNAYNHPSAQMERLREAGLNPRLMYGNGPMNTGQARELPKYNSNNLHADIPAPQVSNLIQDYQDIKLRQAQTDLVNEQARKAGSEADVANATIADIISQIQSNSDTAFTGARLKELEHSWELWKRGAKAGDKNWMPSKSPAVLKYLAELGSSQSGARSAEYDALMKAYDQEYYHIFKWLQSIGGMTSRLGVGIIGKLGGKTAGKAAGKAAVKAAPKTKGYIRPPKKFSKLWWTMKKY